MYKDIARKGVNENRTPVLRTGCSTSISKGDITHYSMRKFRMRTKSMRLVCSTLEMALWASRDRAPSGGGE